MLLLLFIVPESDRCEAFGQHIRRSIQDETLSKDNRRQSLQPVRFWAVILLDNSADDLEVTTPKAVEEPSLKVRSKTGGCSSVYYV